MPLAHDHKKSLTQGYWFIYPSRCHLVVGLSHEILESFKQCPNCHYVVSTERIHFRSQMKWTLQLSESPFFAHIDLPLEKQVKLRF